MKSLKLIMVSIALFALPVMGSAQSMDYIRQLIDERKYMEAARLLRPLADGGDAEAQYLAATFFFEGKGVTRNDAQGVKYATLSADQGYADAMLLLLDKASNEREYFTLLNNYISLHPYLMDEGWGFRLAACYLQGYGVTQDTDKAWNMVRNRSYFNQFKARFSEQWEAYKIQHPEQFRTISYSSVYVAQGANGSSILSVVVSPEYTQLKMRYTNPYRSRQSLYTPMDYTYLEYKGKKYKAIQSTLPSRMSQLWVEGGQSHTYTVTFEPIPYDCRTFDLVVDRNGGRWSGITLRNGEVIR